MMIPEKQNQLYRLGIPDDRDVLRAVLAYCGHEWYSLKSRNFEVRGMRHPKNQRFLIWQYTLSGEGRLEYGGREYELSSGQAMLITQPEHFRYYLPQESAEWEVLFLAIFGSECLRLADRFRDEHGFVFRHPRGSGVVRLAWEIFDLSRSGIMRDRFRASAFAYEFMMRLLSEDVPGSSAFRPEISLCRLRTYCAANLQRAITVDDLAAEYELSRGHFSRLFLEKFGLTPHRFVIEQRLDAAKRLLLTTNYTIERIAAECGFTDASYFCRAFRREVRVSPDSFRKQY